MTVDKDGLTIHLSESLSIVLVVAATVVIALLLVYLENKRRGG